MGARTVIIGVGNALLGDDGVGVVVARRLATQRSPSWDADVIECAVGGLGLAERMVGYRLAIVVDALLALDGEPAGRTRRITLADCRSARHAASTHDTDLPLALATLAELGEPVPDAVELVGITAERMDAFDDRLSAPVAAAADALVASIAARFDRGEKRAP